MKNVFASRWKALYWSLGVMVTAYCTIPAAEPDSAAPKETKVAAVQHPHHNNKDDPWAKDGSNHIYVKGHKSSSLAAGYFDDKAVKMREKVK